MPELCRFYGIIIRMYFADHNPPHFHAFYGEHEAVIDIRTLALIGGYLPARALGLVIEWAAAHQSTLLDAWSKASQGNHPGKVPPLP